MQHNCHKKPNSALRDTIICEDDGKWWWVRMEVRGIIAHLTRITKIRELKNGKCPWCKANLVYLAKVWPHICKKKQGRGAQALVATSRKLQKLEVGLEIDYKNPTRALYTVTYQFVVTECPDCGVKLFEE